MMSLKETVVGSVGRAVHARSVLMRYLTPGHRKQLALVAVWACAVSLLDTAVAGAVIPYVGCLSDRCPAELSSLIGRQGWSLIPALSAALFLLVTAKLLVQGGFAWYSARFTQVVQRDTVLRLLRGYLHMDCRTFRRVPTSHYFQRCAMTAIDAASVTTHYIALISSTLTLVFLGGLAAWQYPASTIPLACGFAVLAMLGQRLMARAQRSAAHAREVALHALTNGIAQSFASFREIRVYQLERFFLELFQQRTNDILQATVRLNFYPSLPRLVVDFTVLAALLIAVSGWMLLGRPASELLSILIFYGIAARSLLPAMMNLLSARAALVAGQFNIDLVLAELDHAAMSHAPITGVPPERSSLASFVLDHVTFGYDPATPVIDDATFTIEHPSWVAVVGPSGAGKSTLIELLCGIAQPQSGRVRHGWPGASDAPRIAYIPQQVALLDGTIMRNVVFGADTGDDARVREALRLACLDEVVGGFAAGVEENVEADGVRLSGGQRQRLAIARAIYRNPDLLLLDEATSGLDEATESQLLSNLRRERPAMSVVYTTHRTGNLHFADQIVLVEAGRLKPLPHLVPAQ